MPNLPPCSRSSSGQCCCSVAEQYGAEICDLDTIAAADDIDAVIVCTPDRLACGADRTACAAVGKAHLPVKSRSTAYSVRGCAPWLEVVDETGATFMVGDSTGAFEPHFMRREALARELGRIGKPGDGDPSPQRDPRAAGGLHHPFRRHLQGHDDPRLRHGRLPDG